MNTKYLNKILNNDIIFALLLISYSFLIFYEKNLFEIGSFYQSLIIIYLVSLLLICFFSFFLALFNKNFKKTFLFFGIFFFLSFYYLDIKKFLILINVSFYSKLSIFIVIFLTVLVFYNYIKFNLFRTFLKFFLIFNYCFLGYLYSEKFFFLEKKIENFENQIDFPKTIQNIQSNNIYLIVVDGMVNLEKLNSFENFNINYFKKFLKNNKFQYLNEAKSVGNTTRYTLGSFFNLNPILVKQINYDDRWDTFFPTRDLNKTNLVKLLKKFNYNFFHIGNSWLGCFEHCLPQKKNLKIFNTNKYLNFYLIDNFLNNTYYHDITKIINFRKIDTGYKKNVSKHAIDKFIDYFKNSNIPQKNNFFFIHNLSPHPPYIFEKNCNIKKDSLNFSEMNSIKINGYVENYLCTLKKIENIINLIKKKDSNAFVIITADHGWSFLKNVSDSSFEFYKERLENIFLIYKPNKKCEKDKLILNNLNILKFSIKCSFYDELKLLENKSYIEIQKKIANKKISQIKEFDK